MIAEPSELNGGRPAGWSHMKSPLYRPALSSCASPSQSVSSSRDFNAWTLLLLSLWVFIFCGCEKKKTAPPPPEVRVITVAPTNVPVFQEWIGTLDGFVNAQIRAQVTGYLLTQNYVEGAQVKKGDLL